MDQHIAQGHGAGQVHGDVALGAMGGFLGVADQREHGEGGLHEHTVVPGAAWADLEVGWSAPRASERGIGAHDHPFGEAGDEGMGGAVVGVGGLRAPGAHQPPLVELVEGHAALAAADPAVVGDTLAPATRGGDGAAPGRDGSTPPHSCRRRRKTHIRRACIPICLKQGSWPIYGVKSAQGVNCEVRMPFEDTYHTLGE